MPARTLLALVIAPVVAGLVYALLVVTTTSVVLLPLRPELVATAVSGSIIGLLFAVLVLLPFVLAFRSRLRARTYLFLTGLLVWFVLSVAASRLGMDWSSSVATAVQLLLPGAVLVALFAGLVGLPRHA